MDTWQGEGTENVQKYQIRQDPYPKHSIRDEHVILTIMTMIY